MAAAACAVSALSSVLAGCGEAHRRGDYSPVPPLASAIAVAAEGRWRATGTDTFEVWVCDVPADATSPMYGGLPLRRQFDPARLAALLSKRVPGYFATVSGGLYQPEFVAGGTVALGRDEEPTVCVDRAIEGARSTTRAVLVVATAEHAPGQPGGTGSAGEATPNGTSAPVSLTRRYVYIGAADFAPEWGDDPPVDLVEHEIGHSLGWTHSGVGQDGSYTSPVDLMSNSAAPRRNDPMRRDGPEPIALHRLMAGWLPPSAVLATRTKVHRTLEPSTSSSGLRLLVVAVDSRHFITVERLVPGRFNDHLPHEGLSVHEVVVEPVDGTDDTELPTSPTVGGDSADAKGPVIDAINPLHGFSDGLSLIQRGDSFLGMGWKVAFLLDGSVKVSRT